MKIYKYPLKFIPNEPALITVQGELLSVQMQNGGIVCYATYSEESRKSTYELVLCETGANVNCIGDKEYLNTLMLYNGAYVLHVFAKRINTEVHI